MRKTYNFFLPVLLLAMLFTACKKDADDAPLPVEGLKSYSGKGRAKVEFTVPADAKSGKVFYGTGNFVEFSVTDPSAWQTIIIDNLPEGEQILRVVTINAAGKVSDPKGVKVKVYGNNYEGALRPRKWEDQVNHSPTSIELFFEPAFSQETIVRVLFTNTSGVKDSVDMPASQTSVLINNINTEEPYYFYSIYKPEADAIDLFASANVDAKNAILFSFKKEGWVIAGVSDEVTGREAAMAIDNNVSTFWKSAATVPPPGTKPWITIDMITSKVVEGFSLLNPSTNDKSAKRIRIEASDDNVNWTNILEAPVKVTYLRQSLPLEAPVTARYFKITALEMYDANTPGMVFAEIDTYNIQGTSGNNGKDAYSNSAAVALVNAKQPFTGDGSDRFPTLGEKRMQRLQGWSHSANATVSYDNAGAAFSLFTASVWGLPDVTNGKVYQTVNLQPGKYVLKINVGGADGPVTIYGTVVSGGELPDFTSMTAAPAVLRYMDLIPYQSKTVELPFTVETAGPVSIGVVYNISTQYFINGTPWSSFGINGLDLSRVEL